MARSAFVNSQEANKFVATVGNGFIEIELDGVTSMPESSKFQLLMEQNMGQIAQSGAIAQNNFITISKAQDYDHLAGGVSLEESLGAREVRGPLQPPVGT